MNCVCLRGGLRNMVEVTNFAVQAFTATLIVIELVTLTAESARTSFITNVKRALRNR